MGVKELDYVDEDEVLESLKDLLKKGKKTEAIKEYRVATGESLKESKEKIDEFYEKLKERFDITFDLNGVNIHLNLFIAIMNMENGKINKNNFYKYIFKLL